MYKHKTTQLLTHTTIASELTTYSNNRPPTYLLIETRNITFLDTQQNNLNDVVVTHYIQR